MHQSGLDPWGLLVLVAGVVQAGVLAAGPALRLPEWLTALLVFGTLVCLVLGLAVLVL